MQPFDRAHDAEHCLEVHLPFLQRILGRFSLVPLVVGAATGEQVAAVVERLWGGDETLVVVSSDLSHYHDYATARRLDRATCDAIARAGARAARRGVGLRPHPDRRLAVGRPPPRPARPPARPAQFR